MIVDGVYHIVMKGNSIMMCSDYVTAYASFRTAVQVAQRMKMTGQIDMIRVTRSNMYTVHFYSMAAGTIIGWME